MNKTIGAAALLIAAIAAPVNEARAQDMLGGALLGGAAGAFSAARSAAAGARRSAPSSAAAPAR